MNQQKHLTDGKSCCSGLSTPVARQVLLAILARASQ